MDVDQGTLITLWFDELMDEESVRDNFDMWPAVSVANDMAPALAIDPTDPDVLYAGTMWSGVFKSNDGAETWEWLTPSDLRFPIAGIWISGNNPDLIYVATADSGFYKSADGGATWQSANNGLPVLNVQYMTIDPSDDDIIYLILQDNGIYKSEDAGENWIEKNNGVRVSRAPRDIAINPLDPSIVFAASSGDFILRSLDGGDSWERLRTGMLTNDFSTVDIHPLDTSQVFAGSNGGGFYKSGDGGNNWSLISAAAAVIKTTSIILHPQDTSSLMIAAPGGVFVTEDQGLTWTGPGDIPAANTIFTLSMDPSTPDHVFATTAGGVYRSLDFGGFWLESNHIAVEDLYLTGSSVFETWQDSTTVIAAMDSATIDTTIIFPYVISRALEGWIALGREGDPPVDDNPLATKLIFTPDEILLPATRYRVRIRGTFESDTETLRDTYGAADISGNTFETDRNFFFNTAR
ncbi:MAG: hypothetical protein JSU61_02225 [Fidelibacterota bacterium]|nr:MAG: hypothetical protein JSU61_02225 [Candidatus Neomarinimicrobiota bacterium]